MLHCNFSIILRLLPSSSYLYLSKLPGINAKQEAKGYENGGLGLSLGHSYWRHGSSSPLISGSSVPSNALLHANGTI